VIVNLVVGTKIRQFFSVVQWEKEDQSIPELTFHSATGEKLHLWFQTYSITGFEYKT